MASELRDMVERLALLLPPTEREELAQTLLDSLELTETDEAWIEVAGRRARDLLRGKVQGIHGEQVIPEIRRELGWQS